MFYFGKNKRPDSSNGHASQSLPPSGSGFEWDPEEKEPALRCSICTGEQVAGFRDRKSGAFTEIMLVRGPSDLEKFRKEYGLTAEQIQSIRKIY